MVPLRHSFARDKSAMVGVRALCGCCVFLVVAAMLLGELDFVTQHIGEPPARRVVDSVLLRSIIGSAWVDRPEQQLLTLRPPDRVRTNVQQEYPPSNTTILAFVNSGYWPWVEHLLNNVAALGLSQHLLVVAEDRPCFNNLRRRGVRAQLAAGEGSGSGGKLLPYNSKAYKSLVHQMPRQVLRLLRSGQAVFLLDADVTLLANPLEYLAPTGHDLYVQDDFREVGARINGGFFFARPTPGAQQVFEDMLAYIDEHPSTYNQPAFNWALRRNRHRLRIKVFDPLYFVNGLTMFQRNAVSKMRVIPVAVHHNWAEPQAYKLRRAVESGLLAQRPYLDSLLMNFSRSVYGQARGPTPGPYRYDWP